CLLSLEDELFRRADIVFTGGQSLYETKRWRHANVHAFPSSIDAAHFTKARQASTAAPADPDLIPRPRFGFFGVLDERLATEVWLEAVDRHLATMSWDLTWNAMDALMQKARRRPTSPLPRRIKEGAHV